MLEFSGRPLEGRTSRDAEGSFAIEDLRPGSHRSAAKVFPYRWDIKTKLIDRAMEPSPWEGSREVSYLPRESFEKGVDLSYDVGGECHKAVRVRDFQMSSIE